MITDMVIWRMVKPPKLVILALLVYSFFQIKIATTIFIIIIVLTEGHQFIIDKLGKPKNNIQELTQEDFKVFKKYHIYFSYPFASRSVSSLLSGIQLSSFIWVPWLLYNRCWWQAIFIAVNYLIAAHFAFRLNPSLFLHNAIKDKKLTDIPPENFKEIKYYLKLKREMETIDSLAKKYLKKDC